MSPTTLLKSTAALTLLLLSAGSAQATPFTYQVQLFDQPGGSTVIGQGSFTADVGTSTLGECGDFFVSPSCVAPGNPIISAFSLDFDLSAPLDFNPPSFGFGLADVLGFIWQADGLGKITDYGFVVGDQNGTKFAVVVDAPNGIPAPSDNSTGIPRLNSWFLVGDDLDAQCGLDNDEPSARTACVSTTTVPEPGVLALMGLGLAGITAFRRRAITRG